MAKKHSHYYDREPDVAHQSMSFQGSWEDQDFTFLADRGVFSKQHVDPGTNLLLETVLKEQEDAPSRVLDLGTGVGVMAIVLAKLRPSFDVTGSDVNRRALMLAKENAKKFGATQLRFIEADGVPKHDQYDLILSNPPIRAGKETVYRLFFEAREALSEQGALYVVIRVKQGAASAKKELGDLFSKVTTVARAKGYHVIKAWDKKKE